MNRSVVLLAGFLLISAGVMTAVYQTVFQQEITTSEQLLEKILEGEEYLQQSSKTAHEKALSIFSELSAKKHPDLYFRVRFNLGKSLEKTGDKYRALEIYQGLNRIPGLSLTEQENLGVSIGDLLLRLNRETEGKVHLDSVLRTSTDRKIRSQVFQSLGNYYFQQSKFEEARKQFTLAVKEDSGSTEARIGLGRVLRKMGKDWAAYEIYDEYLEESASMNGTDPSIAQEYKSDVFEKAKGFFVAKQYYRAIEYFQKAIQLNPSGSVAENSLFYLASCYDALGKQTEAIQYLNKVLNNSVYSLDQEALFKKGTIYFRKGKYDQAASVFQVAIEKYPKNHISEKAMAWKKECMDMLREKGEFQETKSGQTSKPSTGPGGEGQSDKWDDLDLEF